MGDEQVLTAGYVAERESVPDAPLLQVKLNTTVPPLIELFPVSISAVFVSLALTVPMLTNFPVCRSFATTFMPSELDVSALVKLTVMTAFPLSVEHAAVAV